MRRLTLAYLITATLLCLFQLGCRTNNDDAIEAPQPRPSLPLAESPDAPVLQKVIGELTQGYPENRIEVCTVMKSDFTDLVKIRLEIAAVKGQPLEDAFILTGVIPSVQYFAYMGKEQILLSEISDKKRRLRMPKDGQGNPSLDYLMSRLDEKCGVKDERP